MDLVISPVLEHIVKVDVFSNWLNSFIWPIASLSLLQSTPWSLWPQDKDDLEERHRDGPLGDGHSVKTTTSYRMPRRRDPLYPEPHKSHSGVSWPLAQPLQWLLSGPSTKWHMLSEMNATLKLNRTDFPHQSSSGCRHWWVPTAEANTVPLIWHHILGRPASQLVINWFQKNPSFFEKKSVLVGIVLFPDFPPLLPMLPPESSFKDLQRLFLYHHISCNISSKKLIL